MARVISYEGEEILFGPQILYQAAEMDDLVVSAEICEDVWSPIPPSIEAAREGAIILANCSASDETIGKDSYREELIKGQSARLIAGYVYANAGDGESTTDVVFGGHNIIAENGTILKEAKRFANEMIVSEIDIFRLLSERRKNTTFQTTEERHLPKVLFHISVAGARDRSDPVCPTRCGQPEPPLRRDPFDPGNGTEEASGAYSLENSSRWNFRRFGFNAGTACDGKSV